MKKILIAVCAIILVAGIAVVTCPQKDAHKDAILLVLNEYLAEEAKVDEQDEEVQALMLLFGNGVTKLVVDNLLVVKNHFLYSEGYITYPETGSKRVSLGVFGHVFTFNKKQLKDITNE